MPRNNPPPAVYVGIDPGASGGIASLYVNGVGAEPVPGTERDVWDAILRHRGVPAPASAFAVIEKVGGYIGEAQPGSAAFKFGQSYGGLRMALVAAGIPFDEVTPRKWQRAMGVAPRDGKGGETKTAFKNRLKAKAQQLFPGVKVTLAISDALLIAEFCRRSREGKL